MNEKEMREELAALEAQNASLKEQKAMRDKIAALEAENASLDSDLGADTGSAEAGSVTAVTEAGGTTAVPAATDAAAKGESGEEAESPAGAATTIVVHKHSRLRSILIGVLVLLSCLMLVVTGVTIWTHYTVLNTNGYMKLVGPVGKDHIQNHVAGCGRCVSEQSGNPASRSDSVQDAPPKIGEGQFRDLSARYRLAVTQFRQAKVVVHRFTSRNAAASRRSESTHGGT